MELMSSLSCFGTLFKHSLWLTCVLKRTEEKQTVVMHKEHRCDRVQEASKHVWNVSLKTSKTHRWLGFNAWFSYQTLENDQQFFTSLFFSCELAFHNLSFLFSRGMPTWRFMMSLQWCSEDGFFFTYRYASKVIKVSFFHQNIHWLFQFTRCSQYRGHRSWSIRNPIATANNHRNHFGLYGELNYEGLQKGKHASVCDYIAVMSFSMASSTEPVSLKPWLL